MKKTIIIHALLLTVGVFLSYADEPQNLLANPTFVEKRADGTPAVWNCVIRNGAQGSAKVEFSVAEGGQDDQSAGRILVPDQPKTGSLAEFSQRVPLKPNTTYYVSVNMKVVQGGAWPNICIEILDDKCHYLPNSVFFALKSQDKVPAGEYGLYECTFTAKPEYKFANLSLRLQDLGKGEVLFDNAVMIELPKE